MGGMNRSFQLPANNLTRAAVGPCGLDLRLRLRTDRRCLSFCNAPVKTAPMLIEMSLILHLKLRNSRQHNVYPTTQQTEPERQLIKYDT